MNTIQDILIKVAVGAQALEEKFQKGQITSEEKRTATVKLVVNEMKNLVGMGEQL